MVLTDPQRGILTASEEYSEKGGRYQIVNKVEKAGMVDVMRVHDYNYIRKVIEESKKVESSQNPNGFTRYGEFIMVDKLSFR